MADSLSIGSKETTGTGPKDAEMAALYDKAQADPNTTEAAAAAVAAAAAAAAAKPANAPVVEVPEWLPEKFHAAYKENPAKALEAVTKSYAELEKGKGKPAEETPAENKPAETPTPGDAAEAVKAAGLDFNEFSVEFAEKGELSPESYEKLEKGGLARDMVDSYIAGQKAIAEGVTTTLYEATGGRDNYVKMIEWAGTAFSPDDIAAYDAAMNGTASDILLAAEGLKARYQSANGNEPKLLDGGNSGGETGDVYADVAQMQKDMSSSEYANSPAFRAKVAAKLGRSNIM